MSRQIFLDLPVSCILKDDAAEGLAPDHPSGHPARQRGLLNLPPGQSRLHRQASEKSKGDANDDRHDADARGGHRPDNDSENETHAGGDKEKLNPLALDAEYLEFPVKGLIERPVHSN